MSKFDSPLAEELFEYTLDGCHDEDLGGEGFGWFALFREEGTILHQDSQGFVGVISPEDVDAEWTALSDRWGWFQLTHLDESCNGLFLILDAGRHSGWVPESDEVAAHINGCPKCQALGNCLEA